MKWIGSHILFSNKLRHIFSQFSMEHKAHQSRFILSSPSFVSTPKMSRCRSVFTTADDGNGLGSNKKFIVSQQTLSGMHV
jgi:hypothetical protein